MTVSALAYNAVNHGLVMEKGCPPIVTSSERTPIAYHFPNISLSVAESMIRHGKDGDQWTGNRGCLVRDGI